MTQINLALFQLRQTDSTSEKLKILSKLKGDKIAEEVLNFALNPDITFGISLPEICLPLRLDVDLTWEIKHYWTTIKILLSKLASREYTGHTARYHADHCWKEGELKYFIFNIINKDLRAGINIELVNHAIPGLIEIKGES